MAYVSKLLNAVKDGLIWAADRVEDHPWITLAVIAALVVVAIVL